MNLSNKERPLPRPNRLVSVFGGTTSTPNTWSFDKESFHLIMNEDYEQSHDFEMPSSKSYCSQHLQKGIVFQHVNQLF